MDDNKKRLKGSFGDAQLPVSRKYIIPGGRHHMMFWGTVGVILLLGYTAFSYLDLFDKGPVFVSNGPLSSNHASVEKNCDSCHTLNAVTIEKCSSCHEKFSSEALPAYSFESHYLTHLGEEKREHPTDKEMACFKCHPEHLGRDGVLTEVADNRCLQCHDYGGFNKKHPGFEVASLPDESSLNFTHIRHVREVMKRKELTEAQLELSCLYCHNPEPEGKNFQPLNFDIHCNACHSLNNPTTRLEVRNETKRGVITLDEIKETRPLGSSWAFAFDPNEFGRRKKKNKKKSKRQQKIRKQPLHHRDPWILANLRELRKLVHPDGGLPDLLNSSADVRVHEVPELYREAIGTLESYSDELRGSPEREVQKQLTEIDAVLGKMKRALRDPYLKLDKREFELDTETRALGKGDVKKIMDLASRLTKNCQVCHQVNELTIARVHPDQRTMHRAQFNHKAHILQTNCLDCHKKIPIREYAFNKEDVEAEKDQSVIQNLPDIDSCRNCHNNSLSSNSCVTCHNFHPDKERRSRLLLDIE
jgi:phage FluMu protein Com